MSQSFTVGSSTDKNRFSVLSILSDVEEDAARIVDDDGVVVWVAMSSRIESRPLYVLINRENGTRNREHRVDGSKRINELDVIKSHSVELIGQ